SVMRRAVAVAMARSKGVTWAPTQMRAPTTATTTRSTTNPIRTSTFGPRRVVGSTHPIAGSGPGGTAKGGSDCGTADASPEGPRGGVAGVDGSAPAWDCDVLGQACGVPV